jgi:hypothetical protein
MERGTKRFATAKRYYERFNPTYREDVLDANIFHSIEHAQQLTDAGPLNTTH